MRAWVFKQTGKPSDVLKLEDNWPQPVPAKGRVLVRIHACSLNPGGLKLMSVAPLSYAHKKPGTPEPDFSGEIAGGEDLEALGFKLGDEVCGMAMLWLKTGAGTLAQYTVADSSTLVRKPANLTHAEAATIGAVGTTSFYSLVNIGGLKQGAGQRVFINGGSSGTGTAAIQIAKFYGAHVVATCSSSSRSLVESLGADETIDYRSVNLATHLSSTYVSAPFDIIYDCVGLGELFHASTAYLKPEGAYVDIAGSNKVTGWIGLIAMALGVVNKTMRPRILGGTPRKYSFVVVSNDLLPELLKEVAQLFADGESFIVQARAGVDAFVRTGTIRPVIDATFKFEDALKAYELQMSGRAKGKVVVLVD